MTIQQLYSIFLQHPIICTDTRKITPGCLFFALKGENFNGNTFAVQSLETGAAYAIIDEKTYLKDGRCILVDDVLGTLQQLANHHRKQLNIPVIGITGSNGKTTTKELINAVLSQRYKTYATQGNLNNHIGVPLTLLSITPDVEIAIVEMGANHQQEIALLSSIAEPTHGLISNVGKAHLEGFGGFEGVKKGKGELYDFLQQSHGITFINHDNPHLMEMYKQRALGEVVFYGTTEGCFVKGELVANDPFLTMRWFFEGSTYQVKSQLTGSYNVENILSAIAIGLYLGLSPNEINAGITGYEPTNNRSQVTQTTSNTLICDFYNANPSSMSAALDNFSGINTDQKMMILGDMFELGEESEKEHAFIIEKAQQQAAKRIFIGKNFYPHQNHTDYFFETTSQAFDFLKNHPVKHTTILIKGSRGMKLESLVELL